MNIAVFVAADGSKPSNSVVIWQSQLPRCLRKLPVPTRPAGPLLLYQCNVMDEY